MKYKQTATTQLQDLMKKYPSWGVESGSESKLKAQETFNILSAVGLALNNGTDPNPIPNCSLLAWLCAYPFEFTRPFESLKVSNIIHTAVVMGTDTSIPLLSDIYQNDRDDKVQFVSSPLSPLCQTTMPEHEARKRLKAATCDMTYKQLCEVLIPNMQSEISDLISIETPLLCEWKRPAILEDLLDIIEKNYEKSTLSHVLNEPVRAVQNRQIINDKAISINFNYRFIHDELMYNLGNTPLHHCALQSGNDHRWFAYIVKRFARDGAMLDLKNAQQLTPYGLTCAYGNELAQFPQLFMTNPVLELTSRDRMGRLPITNVLRNVLEKKFQSPELRNFLAFYHAYEAELPSLVRNECHDVLSHTLSAVVNQGQVDLVTSLLDASASAEYFTPGELPTWQKAALSEGDCNLTRTLIKSVSTPMSKINEWLAQHKIAYSDVEPEELVEMSL